MPIDVFAQGRNTRRTRELLRAVVGRAIVDFETNSPAHRSCRRICAERDDFLRRLADDAEATFDLGPVEGNGMAESDRSED